MLNLTNNSFYLSLTSKDSHFVELEDGQGSFYFGPSVHKDAENFDAIVDPETKINWTAFNGLLTPAKGHWPRWFYYIGNDVDFIEWSKSRNIESFTWDSCKSLSVDFSGADIIILTIVVSEKITLAASHLCVRDLIVRGQLENISIHNPHSTLKHVAFHPNLSINDKSAPYQLPMMPALSQIKSIEVGASPIGQAFDCSSLLQFRSVESLSLSGNLINLEALAMLDLKNIAIRYCPNLDGFPALKNWDKLNSIILWNIDESFGKPIRAELNKLKKVRHLEGHCTVSKLRKKDWFVAEYGLPFSAWSQNNEKKASRAYKVAAKKIAKAESDDEVRFIIKEFLDAVNKLRGIETTERDDMAFAVNNLVKISSIPIDLRTAERWFDEFREF